MTDSIVTLLIAGTSGYACEVRNTIEQSVSRDLFDFHHYGGCFGPDPPVGAAADILAPYLGNDSDIGKITTPNCRIVLGVGNPATRQRIVAYNSSRFGFDQFPFHTLIHPSVMMSWIGHANIGDGVVIHANTVLTTNVTIGDYAMVNQLVSIGHDVEIGEYSVINPLASISGGVKIGREVLIGTGANILEGLVIGDGAIVGAGSVVTKDVAPGVTVVGIPAKPIGE